MNLQQTKSFMRDRPLFLLDLCSTNFKTRSQMYNRHVDAILAGMLAKWNITNADYSGKTFSIGNVVEIHCKHLKDNRWDIYAKAIDDFVICFETQIQQKKLRLNDIVNVDVHKYEDHLSSNEKLFKEHSQISFNCTLIIKQEIE